MTKKRPTHIVYHVKDLQTPGETEPSRGIWTRVGAAWTHNDAKGLTLVLDVVPLDGRLMVREAVQEGEQCLSGSPHPYDAPGGQ